MLSIIITAFKEPKTIGKAVESFLNQKIKVKYEILVVCPDKETAAVVNKYFRKDKIVKHFKDPGKGKSYALNLIFKKVKSDILILTDGDVCASNNSVNEILKLFENKKIGCVTGRPVPIDNRSNRFGYWAHFLYQGGHKARLRRFKKQKFLECSGYLFAFRNKIKEIPLDVAEDTYIPYKFAEKGYQIGYAYKAKVYVKNPTNLKDMIKQKVRTAKAHETLYKYVDVNKILRMKSFTKEVWEGIPVILTYHKNLKEFFWTTQICFIRLYIWFIVFYQIKFKKQHYQDNWERAESTKHF